MFRFIADVQQIMANNRARKRMAEEGAIDLKRREVEALEEIAKATRVRSAGDVGGAAK